MEATKSSRQSRWYVGASIVCYLAALSLKAFCYDGGECPFGIAALLLGGFELLFEPLAGIPWLANPLLVLGWILIFRRSRAAVAFTAGSLPCALLFLATPGVVADEGGGRHDVTSFQIGYWLWVSSCVLALIAAVLAPSSSRKSARQ